MYVRPCAILDPRPCSTVPAVRVPVITLDPSSKSRARFAFWLLSVYCIVVRILWINT